MIFSILLPSKRTFSISTLLFIFMYQRLAWSIEYIPELVSTIGLPGTRITCVGEFSADDNFYDQHKWAYRQTNIALLCAVHLGVACGRMKDTQGNYQELLLPNAPYLVPAGQANSQVQWKYIAPAIQNAWSPRPELSTAFDFCFIKCRCADGATRRQADRNRRRLPAVGSEEIIAPFVIGFDHGRDVYFQKITDRPLVFGYELDETPYMQTDLILHKTSSRYMAAHWGNYLDQKDFPANSAADAAARAEMDLVSSARFWNTEQNQAKAARNKAHPSPPQVLFASGQRRNQPRCKVAPLPEYMKQSFVVLNIPMEYDDATQICPHQVYGGNRTANLGGVCLLKPDKPLERFLDFPYYTRHPFFTNEIAQRSLVGDTLIAALLQFCRESCRCPTDPDYETITPKVPGETEAGQGGEPERREDEPGSIGTNILGYSVLRSKTRGGDDFHGQFDGCSVMGLTCTGSRSHGECSRGCSCRISSQTVDSAKPGMFLFQAQCSGPLRTGGLIGGFASSLWPRAIESEALCPCNVTYVSRSCCEVPDGMVWEEPCLQLGRLKV